jgi:hypothetical protein
MEGETDHIESMEFEVEEPTPPRKMLYPLLVPADARIV